VLPLGLLDQNYLVLQHLQCSENLQITNLFISSLCVLNGN
jgi:hypothetical protein